MEIILSEITKLLNFINVKFSGSAFMYFIPVLIIAIILLIFLIIRQKKVIKASQLQTEVIDRILTTFQPEKGLEENLANLLDLVIPIVKAESYFFYLLESNNSNYVLKALRYTDHGPGQIAPSYSGLVPYQKENYNPPLNLPVQQSDAPSIVKHGEVPMLMLPIKGGIGLILAGPVQKVPKQIMAGMKYLNEKLEPALHKIMQIEKMKNQLDSIVASSKAIRTLTRSVFDVDGSLSALMGLSLKIVDAAGGCFLVKKENRSEAAVVSGLKKETVELLRRDQETHDMLHKLAADEEFVMLTREKAEYFNIPSYFAALGIETLLLVRVYGSATYGTAILWYSQDQVIEQHRIATLQMLTKRMGDVLDRQLKIKELSVAYLDMLKMVVTAVDNLEPQTVGHSELISRYTGIICSELKLGKKDIREIMLAGFLHDVGMMGLSGDILFKSGTYTDIERGTMKLHAEIGAAIIESTVANKLIASYIRHHHERWDGFGYPAGLKGEAIPLGARIIAVADAFNAKVTGRKYREPVPFEKVVSDLRAAAGTQLDPNITEVLIDWFQKKQADPSIKGHSLGACWEMRCCPSNIGKFCPAYKKTDMSCWELEGTNCAAHGNACPTCIIYTEFTYRNMKMVEKGK